MNEKHTFRRISVLLTIITGAFASACNNNNTTPTPVPTPTPTSSQGVSTGGLQNQKVDFTSAPPQTVQLNSCNALTLQVEDAKTSAPEAATENIYVTLYFLNAIPYSDAGCSNLIGSYTFLIGQETKTVYYKTITSGKTTLELSTTDSLLFYTNQVTYTQTVQLGAPAELQVFYSAAVLTGPTMPPISVCVVDNLGNIIPQAGTSVAVQLASNPTDATLSGTLTEVTDAAGCAGFSDLSFNLSGVYTLQASGDGFTHTTGNITASANSGGSAGSSSGANPNPSPSPSGSSSGSSVDCTNISNANVPACAGTDPSYCLNPSYANFAPCTGSYPSYCSISSYANTLACTGSNPNGIYCQENPTAMGCSEYCTFNPDAQGCPNFCNVNPTAAGCPQYCDVNPTAQGCPEYCDFNPTGQGCPTYCDENPTAQGCPEYCDYNPTGQGCPEYCDFNPTSQGCPEYCEFNITAPGC